MSNIGKYNAYNGNNIDDKCEEITFPTLCALHQQLVFALRLEITNSKRQEMEQAGADVTSIGC
jgi:hypothetical protein